MRDARGGLRLFLCWLIGGNRKVAPALLVATLSRILPFIVFRILSETVPSPRVVATSEPCRAYPPVSHHLPGTQSRTVSPRGESRGRLQKIFQIRRFIKFE